MSLTTGISCLAVLLLFRSVDWRTYSSSFFGFSFNKGYPRYRCKAIHFVFSSVFGRHEFCKHQHYCKQQSWKGLSCHFSRFPEGISLPSWWVRESLGTHPSERVSWLFLFSFHHSCLFKYKSGHAFFIGFSFPRCAFSNPLDM